MASTVHTCDVEGQAAGGRKAVLEVEHSAFEGIPEAAGGTSLQPVEGDMLE